MKLLNKLERRFGRYAIDNLMLIICGGQALAFIADVFMDGLISSMFFLGWPYVMQGQVWRCITFIFVPGETSLIGFILSLYFYYMIGGALENEWGAFNFNCYYLLGMICCNIAAAISGYSSSMFINQAMFFAFALLYPEFQVLLFYLIPIKVKWLALLDAAIYVYEFIVFPQSRWTIILSLVPVAVFFTESGYRNLRRAWLRWKNRRTIRSNWK